VGSSLKEDAFVSSIRQRFAIPGAACSFDLPHLHFWMNLPESKRKEMKQSWFGNLKIIDEAITLTLSFLRQRGRYQKAVASNGFFPGLTDDKGELVQVRLDVSSGCYPTLSGNKYRYALRFMQFSEGTDSIKSTDSDIEFEIASC
jgi:cell division protein ZapD